MSGSIPGPPANRLGIGRLDLILLGVPLVWGVNYAVIKAALNELQPLAFNGLRFTLATLTIWLLMGRLGTPVRIPRQRLWTLVLLGVLGNGLYQLLFIEGMARTTASNASLIMASVPVEVALLGTGLRSERLRARGWAGVLLAAGGLALLLSTGEGGGYIRGNLVGDLLMLVAASSWALYTVLGASAMAHTPSLGATLVTFLAGTPILLLAAVPSFIRQDWRAVGVAGWAGVAFSGIVAIGLAYLAWNTGLGAIGGTRTAVYSNLTPVVAAAVGWFTLGESWGAGQLLGAAAVLLGVTLTRRGTVPRGAPPAARSPATQATAA
jgi:drug/metabolite transporter (DMT)-like permease